ncbi:MAG TPA: hypothetical protein VHE09_15175, partial [Rhizomicrobium sp.]|nr:hypothetical protein [Rhizomicrobium sp.]
ENHTGRPEVAPWLRGWVEPDHQTTVIWRTYLPVREDVAGWPRTSAEKKELENFFDAAPPHESEKLETENFRVADWLQDRAVMLLHRKPPKAIAKPANRQEEVSDEDAEESGTDSQNGRELQRDDIVAMVLSASAEYERCLTLRELAQDRKGRIKEEFLDKLIGKILIMDARFGGLKDGMLNGKADGGFPTADADKGWGEEAGFRVRPASSEERESEEDAWHFEDDFVLRANDDGDAEKWLIVEHYQNVAQSEDARSISRRQELARHQSLAERKARDIAGSVGLSGIALDVLTLAARLHDEGKRASRWQRAFRAPHEKDEAGAYKIFAKTPGPINQQILDGYRHEFGSLAVFEPESDLANALPADVRNRIQDLPEEWRDLVLHLIAAHHGFGRPVISTRGCEDAPPSALEERAREVALRFARLQKRWGPWGLAWWESLLRAADQQASRTNDEPESNGASHAEK